MNWLNKPIAVKSISKSSYQNIDDNTQNELSASLIYSGRTVQIELADVIDMKWTTYLSSFALETESGDISHVLKTFQIKPKIHDKINVGFAQNENWSTPTNGLYTTFP